MAMGDAASAALGANPLGSLLAVCPFDSASVVPKEFDFRPHMVDKTASSQGQESGKSKDKEGQPKASSRGQESGKSKDKGGQPQRLPHRLLLSAFSTSVGHRPTGLQVAQAKLFVERFPSEFREMSMQKVVLPCSMDGSLPFVVPGGALPCPALSTFNALKYLQAHPEALAKSEPRAKAQMARIFSKGVQIEWLECESFLHWQLHVETSSVQASVQVAPHIVDTALKYLAFCSSAPAAQDVSEQSLDEGFSRYLQGKSSHRLKEAKTLLNSSEPAVIGEIAKWRKGVHYLHANSLAQVYLLSTEEWSALHGKQVVLEKTTYSLQSVVAKQVMKTIAEAEIVNTGEVPRLRRGAMTLAVFKELCTSVLQAVKYKAALQTQYAGVWGETGSAEKLFKRLIVVGEPGLRQAFLRGLAVAAGKIENLDFQETDPTSDLAQVCARLGNAMEVLRQQQEQEAAKDRAAAAAAAASSSGPAGSAAASSSHAQNALDAAPAPSQDQGSQSYGAAEAAEAQAPHAAAESQTQGQEQKAAEQAPAAEAPAQSQEQREAAEKQAAMDAILQQARIATDDIFLLYDRPWQRGDRVPPGLVEVPAGTLFVAPSPSTSRGLASRAVQALRGPSFEVLELFEDTCAIIAGLGHDPEQKTSARSRLEQINANFKKAKWDMFPVFQKLHSLSYVEYFLVGCGPAFPASSQGQIPKWLGPAPLAVESPARFVACEKQRSSEAILQEMEDTGDVVMCRACRDIQSRFVTPMPRKAKQARQKQDDLLGGLEEASAGESGDEASTVSSHAGDESSGAESEKEPTAKVRGQISAPASAASLKIRPARQGVPASTWLHMLSLMQPSKVVLAGTVTFQAGLLYAILQYNDTIFGLQQCPLVGFCCQEPLSPTVLEWTKKHVKQWQASHLCLHSIERALAAYASRRYSAIAANQKTAVSGVGGRLRRSVLKREGTDTGSSVGLASSQPAEPPQETVTKFIMAHGNHGKDANLLPPPPAGLAEPDSDDPDGDATSSDMSQDVLSKRNSRFLTKHGVKVLLSSEASGHGLFAASDILAGKELPAKGPWFNTLEAVHEYLAGLHADTAKMLSQRVVRLDLAPAQAEAAGQPASSQGQEAQERGGAIVSLYKVITNPVGFINHFTGLQTTPNCQLLLKEGVPKGEHCLVVKSTKAIKEGKQWLLNYGPQHQCGERIARKRRGAGGADGTKLKKKKGAAPATKDGDAEA